MNDVPGGPDGQPTPGRNLVQGKPARQSFGGQAPRADWRRYARIFLWVLVAVLTAAFLIMNKEDVTISFVFFSATVPLFIALIVAIVLGVLLGGSLMWWTARRRRKAAERAD